MKMHIWDVVNHLVYCPIAKVASTTWFSNFLAWSKINRSSVPLVLNQLKEAGITMNNEKAEAGGRGIRTLARCHNSTLNSNLKETLDPLRYIYQAPEASNLEDLTSQFKENTGFLLVRHPLVRLVSAYEDKMLNPHPFPYAYHRRQRQNRFDTNQCNVRVQEEIRSTRGGRKVVINFPEDLLHGQRIQHLLKKKAGAIQCGQQGYCSVFENLFRW